MQKTHSSLPWIRRLASAIPEMIEIPLFGNAPPYDWHQLSASLTKSLEVKDFSLQPMEQTWKERGLLLEGLGDHPLLASMLLHPLDCPIYFAMSQADLDKFLSWMMHKTPKTAISGPLREGFSRFLLLEILDAASKISPLQKLTAQLTHEAVLPHEMAFCIDIEFANGEDICWGRLILPASFRKQWIAHFAQTASEYVSTPFARTAELVLGIKTGSVLLSQMEWEAIRVGDFIILDSNSYHPRKHSGIATLQFESIPLFQVKVKNNKLELLDFATPQEEPMEENQQAQEVQSEKEQSVSIRDIPLPVCVELARIKLTLDQLMHLNPGNLIELPIHPEQGVTLTIHGKKVGRAELLQVGETLGIRILEIGSKPIVESSPIPPSSET